MELATKVMDLKDELKNTNVTLKINAIRNKVIEQIEDNKELADSFLKNGEYVNYKIVKDTLEHDYIVLSMLDTIFEDVEHAQKQMQIQYNDILDELDIKKVEVK
ncbi:hypothetical protein [Staphylococcus hominis]|uniref:hypothetical protein n=1 Tax=Staphylococcus hominis TaxID=1290 RepID=UPI00119CE184|nr:hypothetical protein [Staphylococcus hominis]MCC3712154.1 hypothetical protein [Staphylococcus hominis]MCC3714447.1 hypothetical protein [Staphylococcus hominis]